MTDEQQAAEPADHRTGRVAHAEIEPLGMFAVGVDALLEALTTGTRVGVGEDKEWLMARTHFAGAVIFGRLGFERTGDEPMWDPEAMDIGTRTAERLQVAPFAIDAESLHVVFQIRPPHITAPGFAKALQALMNEASPAARWRVKQIERDESYDHWRARAKRVTKISVKVRRPNPHYDQKPVEDLVENLNAKVATLSAAADVDDPQGIDTEDEFLNAMIEHATERNGEFKAIGEDADGRPISYSSKVKTAEATVPADSETGDVPPDVLRNELQAETDWEEDDVPANPPPPRQLDEPVDPAQSDDDPDAGEPPA